MSGSAANRTILRVTQVAEKLGKVAFTVPRDNERWVWTTLEQAPEGVAVGQWYRAEIAPNDDRIAGPFELLRNIE